jgi:serine protease
MSEEDRIFKLESRARVRAKVAVVSFVLGLVSTNPVTAADERRAPEPPPQWQARSVPVKPSRAVIPPDHSDRLLHLKIVEGRRVSLRGGRLVSTDRVDLSGLSAVLESIPGLRIDRLFSRPEEVLEREQRRIERKSKRQQADKNLYFRLRLPEGADMAGVLDRLNALDIVEIAYAEPLPGPPPVSPDFSGDQEYADAAPRGIDAAIATDICGGRGSAVRVTDIEYSWNLNHEDLVGATPTLVANGTPADPFSDNNHGTAVLGELCASDNGFGVTGLVHQADIAVVNASNTGGYDLADSIDLAAANSAPGDVILLEQQVAGPNAGCDDTTQFGCVAVEWVQAYYDAIVAATSDGIHVVEAAGNGSQDLGDTATYGDPFPAGRADSGAIIVGAGSACTAASARARLGFSNYGPRVNLQGWGECVTTTGYGFLQGGVDPNVWYTGGFSGTSSASPIVTAAVASLSSVAQTLASTTLTPAQVRTALVSTGTAQTGTVSEHIGPLPDLRAALSPYETKPPDVTCPADVVAECTSPAGAAVSFTATATDDCDSTPDVSCSPASGSTFALGTTSPTCTAEDAVGNQDQCSFQVKVQDTTAPSITCPAAVTVECTGNNSISKNDVQLASFFAGVSVSDVCDASLAPSNDAPGFFPLGTTTVTFSVTDDSGNTSTCSTTVKVADTLPPTIDASVSPTQLWPPNHKLVDIAATVAVQDICDPSPGFVLKSILSNEPDNGLGDGDTVGDIQESAFGTSDTAFKLRAERSGNGTGRIYTVNYEASDGSNNKSDDSAVVLVPHDR